MAEYGVGFIIRGTIMQFVVFMLVPFIWWLLKYKEESSFLKWMGLYKPKSSRARNVQIYIICLYWIVWIVLHSSFVSQLIGDDRGLFYKMGSQAIIICFIVSFFQNGLCEELFCRGFMLKRFRSKFSFKYANIFQAFIFAILHIIIGGGDLQILSATVLVLKTLIGGIMFGYISEKVFDGSIVPGVILHGLGNFIIYLGEAFS